MMDDESEVVTRFAPSPTGYLHLGHAYAALFAWRAAHEAGGRFLLRIEDIDTARCRPEYEEAIGEDLAWLGLSWEEPVRRQSEHFADYEAACRSLAERDLVYPCFCTRREIAEEIARAGAAPHGPEGAAYPGTCRDLDGPERARRIARGEGFALRLDVRRALAATGELTWRDLEKGEIAARPERLGDVVLARKDTPASYHLAVSVDDALQRVTLVTRGEDLLEATHVHRLLIELLGLPVPAWRHHRLIVDAAGRRFAKRDAAATLRALREAGRSAASVREELGFR